MVSMEVVYDGNKKCTATHGPSQTKVRTDAPKDIGGDGSAFSPTDMVGAALGACILTTMAMFAERHELDITGARIVVTKEMATQPIRRIGRLAATLTMPASKVPQEMRETLEQVGHNCPVYKTLHPDVEVPLEFVYV